MSKTSKKAAAVTTVPVDAFGADEKANAEALGPAALKAWGSAAMRTMRAMFNWDSIKSRAKAIGRPLEIGDLNELFHKDETAPTGTVCAVCGELVECFVALVVDQSTGELVKDRFTDQPIERGIFVVRKQLDRSMAPEAGCQQHLDFLRIVEVHGEKRKVPAQSFAQAKAKADAINAKYNEESELRRQYETKHGHTSSGPLKGHVGDGHVRFSR